MAFQVSKDACNDGVDRPQHRDSNMRALSGTNRGQRGGYHDLQQEAGIERGSAGIVLEPGFRLCLACALVNAFIRGWSL